MGLVAALVNGGARGDAVGGSGETALQLFVRVGTDDGLIVDTLVAGGADPDGMNPDGETPLHTAISSGGNAENPDVVEALLASGADPCVTDDSGYIPYNTARDGGTVHSMLANAGGSDFACDGREATVEIDADLVRRVQAALATKGYDPGPADGVMGARTRSAIELWQEAMDFTATGILTTEEVEVLLAERHEEPSSSPPGRVCSGAEEDGECWMETADREDCYVRVLYSRPTLTVTWSGGCLDGKASGTGTAVWTYGNEGERRSETEDGSYANGNKHGHWVEHRASGSVYEGPYVDGKKYGHWVGHFANGGSSEGPYLDGKRHGYWVWRWPSGATRGGPYVDGNLHGHWVSRADDGSVEEGPYVDNEKHGEWTNREANGNCSVSIWSYDDFLEVDHDAC